MPQTPNLQTTQTAGNAGNAEKNCSAAASVQRLDDRYTAKSGRYFLTGIQALVRLALMQRRRDRAAGLNTAGFVSGYRGSPLGGMDQALWRASGLLREHDIRFVPAINEELAATAVLGTQQVGLSSSPRHDGVFAMWYGKGPGVDRAGDALKHGNAFGSAPHGGVLVIAGDDHGAVSSSIGHQSEQAMISWMMPVLNPAGVQDYLDLGLMGIALSRFSGCWVGFKAITETVESGAVVSVDLDRVSIREPRDFPMPPGGLHARWPEVFKDLETRLHDHKLKAAMAFARANAIDRVVFDAPVPHLGVVAAGKAYLDLRQAMQDLGIDDAMAARLGLRIYKVGMSWPLEPEGAREFARDLETILVVEEKRPVIEDQLRALLYDLPHDARPRIVGKTDEEGRDLLPSTGELSPERVAAALVGRLPGELVTDVMRRRLDEVAAATAPPRTNVPVAVRMPFFCSGCPHNRSTKVPEGSQAYAGIGCHLMAIGMDRETCTITQMGGEGINWIGREPFTDERHVFQNLGDGTYFHSGLLAIRQAVAAKVNITYKILYNDAVAMTGGQPLDGDASVPEITRQVHAEGVGRIAVVADDPGKYPIGAGFAPGVTLHPREDLDTVQRELREIPGCTVLIYDQRCAAQKRRRRRRGVEAEAPYRVFINPLVCEGCGDCSIQSNCVSVVPELTEFGVRRRIDQSSCNQDYSCLEGFCPAMVTVEGGRPRRGIDSVDPADEQRIIGDLPLPRTAPHTAEMSAPYNILIAGIGGTGVITVGALVSTAASLEGRGASALDFTGLAQKGGAVVSHVRIAPQPEDIHAVRIGAAAADVIVGCDLVASASPEVLATVSPGRTRAVVNRHETQTAAFTLDAATMIDGDGLVRRIEEACGADAVAFPDATRSATALFGDSIATNLFLLGYAWQNGFVPVGLAALERAIELNGVAVADNRRVFAWGRAAAHDPAAFAEVCPAAGNGSERRHGLDELVIERAWYLARYQDEAYARRYRALVSDAARAESQLSGRPGPFAEAVARSYFALLAYKDEYEVARLHSDGTLQDRLAQAFEGDLKVSYHMAPPLLARRDPATGHLRKRRFGRGMETALKLVAAGRRLRGTPFDPFGYQAERRMERRLIAEFEADMKDLMAGLDRDRLELAARIAALPQEIRGFGHVKAAAVQRYGKERTKLLAALEAPRNAIAAE